jgi:hypothetical protein
LPASPQTGGISGDVFDLQGVVLAGARVKLSNSARTLIRETESDRQGHFDFSGIDPGPYEGTAENSLFAPTSIVLTVVAGDHADVKLLFRQIASSRQAIVVTGSPVPSALTPGPSEHVVVHHQVLDANPGLQENLGPSLHHAITVSLQRTFSRGSIYASYARADARDRLTGEPIPEAPRFIWDTVATEDRLPIGLHRRCEFDFVRAKPVGDGLTRPAVTEFRGALFRPFMDGRMTPATEFLIASGYTGETSETFAFPSDPTCLTPIEYVVGVPLKSYIALSWTYRFNN